MILGASIVTACSGSTDCAGVISINATPAECEQIAERNGCTSFEVPPESPTCGLLGCAVCEGD
jgi:hypothetical protein